MKHKSTEQIRRLACLLAFMASSSIVSAIDIYVAPNGNDTNSGTSSSPLKTLLGARNKVRSIAKNQQIRVFFRAGTYRFTQAVNFSGSDSGTSTNPVVYQSYPGETAFFDGGRVISASGFTKVTGSLANRLTTAANGNVWSQVITDATTKKLLEQQQNGMTFNGFLFRPTQSPNVGYYNIDREFSNGAFRILEQSEVSFPLLASEQNRTGQGEVFGYVRREFQAYTIPLKQFAGSGNGTAELDTGTSYLGFPGTPGTGNGNRVRFRNLLGTMDVAREWYFDKTDSRLYLFPPGGNIQPTDRIVVWGGEGAIDAKGASDVYFHNFVIQNFATADPVGNRFDSAVAINNGTNVRLRGCTLRHIAGPLAPFSIEAGGRSCLVDSCDVYDNFRGSRLRGGNVTTGSVVTGANRVSNCHFFRLDSWYLGEAMGVEGRGNIFQNNLVHNSSRQPVSYFGFENVFELNEIYNVCQDEGDGGSIYTGARLYSYNNLLRRNLIHHNMVTPGLKPRCGIYLDDFDAGDTAEENIFFKAGAFSFYSNKGTGNTAQRNIVIKAWSGVRSGGGGSPAYDTCMLYLDRVGGRTPLASIKENYIGKMLQWCGKSGWDTRVNSNNWRNEIDPFWTNRYPKFARSMDAYFAQKTMIPFETRLVDNYFAESIFENVQAPPGSTASNNRNFNLSAMVAPNSGNFDWKAGQRPSGSVNTNDFDPGLVTGTFRASVPNRSQYRLKVSQKFSGVASFEGTPQNVAYNPNLANRNLYNSGKDVVSESQTGLGVKEGDAFKNDASSPSPPPTGGSTITVDTSKTKYDYDFGTSSSAVQSGWVRISPATQGDVTWSGAVSAVDRGTQGGVNNINRDLVYASQTRVLNHKIANGTWKVTLNMGDAGFPHDVMRVRAEGAQVVKSNINSAAGAFPYVNFDVNVSDGQLNLEFSDQGGSDSNWVVTRLTLLRTSVTVTPPSGLTQLEFRHSGSCVDNKGQTANGSEYHQWSCGPNPNRNFTFTSLGGGYYSVKSERSTRCLDVANGSLVDGGKLHQWDCSASNINQSWKLEDRGNGWFQLISRKSEKCLDVENSGTGNSARIFQKNCDTAKQSQQLSFR